MGSVSISGFNAPFNTDKLINELMKVEKRPIRRFEGRIQETKSTKKVFKNLNNKATKLQSQVSKLTSPSTFNSIKASSSDSDILGASVSSTEDAQPGSFDVFVQQMAKAASAKSGQFINNQNMVDNDNFGSDDNSATSISDFEQVEGGDTLSPSSDTLEALSKEVQTSGSGMGSGGDGVDDVKIDFNNDGSFTGFDLDGFDSIGAFMDAVNNHSNNKDGSGNQLVNFRYDSQSDRFMMVPQKPGGSFQIEDQSSVISDPSKGFLQQIGIAENDSVHTFDNTQAEYQTDADTTSNEPQNLLSLDPDRTFSENLFSSPLDSSSGTIQINNTEIKFDSDKSTDKVSTVNGLVDEINSNVEGVSALYNEATDKIKLESKNTGAGSIEVQDKVGNLAEVLNINTEASVDPRQENADSTSGQDAKFQIDGDVVSSSDNSLGFNGLNLKAKKVHKDDGSNDPIEVNVEQDNQSVTDKVNGFVQKFNGLIEFINKKSKVRAPQEIGGEGDPDDSGPLVGDITTRTIQNGLTGILTSLYDEANQSGSTVESLEDVGINLVDPLNSPEKDQGKIEFDSSKFKQALSENPEEVKQLFTAKSDDSDRGGNQDGIATQIDNLMSDVVGRDGLIETRLSGFDDKVQRLRERIKETEERVQARRKSLERKFRVMEKQLGQLQQQRSFLSQRL